MPGFVVHADDILAAGADAIACMAVNDAFVMDAWQKDQNAQAMTMLADGNAEFTRALGLDMDASGGGMAPAASASRWSPTTAWWNIWGSIPRRA